jgi:hypothetical protein
LGGLLAVLASVFVVAALAAGPAAADPTFCPQGGGAGQCQSPGGVAIDAETGKVYVADEGNNRIEAFAEGGGFEATIGAGLLTHPRAVAVDNDPASPTHHDLFVLAPDQARVLRFSPAGSLQLGFGWGVRNGAAEAQTCGPEASPPTVGCLAGIGGKGACQLGERSQIALGQGGHPYIADSAQVGAAESEGFKVRSERFAPGGASCEEEVLFPEGTKKTLAAIAVDSEEDVYLAIEREAEEVRKLTPGGAVLCSIAAGASTSALAVDPASDRLYAAQGEHRAQGPGSYETIATYGAAAGCTPILHRFAYGQIAQSARWLAVFPGAAVPALAGDPLVSEGFGVFNVFGIPTPPEGPIVAPGGVVASPIGNTKATLGAEVNPEGAVSEVTIEYVEEALCEADEGAGGECFEEAEASTTTLSATDFKLHGVEEQIGCPNPLSETGHPGENAYEAGECLQPQTRYRFRVHASNADGEGNSPLDGGAFETRPWLELGPVWATAVGAESAALHAEVNPLGVPVSGRFEVTEEESGFAEAFEVPAPSEAPLDFGAGEALATRAVALGGLAPGVTYHYRLVVSNPLIAPVSGPAHDFTTFLAPGAQPCPANEAFRTGPSAALPDCRAYEMVSPLDKEGGDIAVLNGKFSVTPAALEQSSVSGSRLSYASLHAFSDARSAPFTSQYIASRRERGQLGEGWQSHSISSPIERPIFTNSTAQGESELKALSPDLCQAWIRAIAEPTQAPGARPGYPNLYRRSDEECGGRAYEALSTSPWQNLEPGDENTLQMELQGLAADSSRALFTAPDSLIGSGAPDLEGKALQLYVWAGGPRPVFACVLPGGAALEASCSGGMSRGAVLAGLGRYASEQGAISADGERVFWTAGVDAGKIYMRERPEQGKVAGECSAAKACTIAVSAQGEALSGTSASQFRAASADGSKAIFTSGSDLYLARIGEEGGHAALLGTDTIAHGVLGVMGVSEDASHVYFASSEAIGGAGQNSLGDEAQPGLPNLYLYREGSYAFIGTLSTEDANPGLRSAIEAAPVENLARISPDGAHAAFVSTAALTHYDNADAASGQPDSEVFLYDAVAKKLLCASCNPSGARPAGRINTPGKDEAVHFGPPWVAAWFGGHETGIYASRELSADGSRLFFNSTDSLVPRDTNGRADVYEWEAPGTGGCSTETPTFSPRSEGCVDLISSGRSAFDSKFLDASPSGGDVFFTTLSNLVAQDFDLIDIYDARIGGGFPAPPSPPAECEGEACQSPPPAPADPTPASAAFHDPGNVKQGPKRPRCPKGRHRVSRRGKVRCVKQRRHGKAQR